MLLMTALYKADAGAREKISSARLAGPPSQLLKEEVEKEKDGDIFEMLAFLESDTSRFFLRRNASSLPLENNIRNGNQLSFLVCHCGLSHLTWTKVFPLTKSVRSAPEDIPNQIIRSEEQLGKSRRDLCEAIGVRIGHDPQWGLQVVDVLQVTAQNLPADAINPILWGIRATLTDNSSKITADDVRTLLGKFFAMIEKMPKPSMWSSLPSLIHTLVGKFRVAVESWNELAVRLALIEAFDYEREEETGPIEWRHRSINHPYGDTTELYLTLAQQHVNALSAAGKPLRLEAHAESFFSHMLAHYNIGSRYGLCLLAPWLSWIEAVSAPKLADSLYPDFEWVCEDERSLVAWSGYLWSNTISRRLVENFESTYLTAAKHHSDLASQERRALANHVSAVFWFHPDRPQLLCEFASGVDF